MKNALSNKRLKRYAPWVAGLIIIANIIGLAYQRNYFSFGVETDYLGSFIWEAQRIVKVSQLAINYHPPFYPFTLGMMQLIMEDWFISGIVLSVVSAIIVLFTTYLLFQRLLSSYAAWGALLALFTSPIFLSFSAFASSDMYFLALYFLALLIGFTAFEKSSSMLWFVSGSVIACAFLTRTNGMVLLLMLFLPWFSAKSLKRRTVFFLYAFVGFISVFSLWTGYALYSHSPLMPKYTYLNLAMTFFSSEYGKISGDALSEAANNFTSLGDVLSYDPIVLLKGYVIGLYRLSQRIFMPNELLAFPMNFLVFPALINFLFFVRSREVLFLIGITVAHVLLVNFIAYNARFYLFLVPFFGAALGQSLLEMSSMIQKTRLQRTHFSLGYYLLPFFGVCLSIGQSERIANEILQRDEAELAESISKIKQLVPANSTIVVRKPHINYYTHIDSLTFPRGSNLEDLKEFLQLHSGAKPIFVYWGKAEQKNRKEFLELSNPDTVPSWLTVIAKSEIPGLWILFEFHNE